MELDEVIEINIMDLLCMLFEHWKYIVAAAVIGAVLAVGIGKLTMKDQEEAVNNSGQEEIEAVQEELEEELLASYENRIAVSWEKYQTSKRYLEKSPLQKLDAEEIYQQVSLYAVSVEEADQAAYRVALLQEAYQSMALDGRLYEEIRRVLGMETEIQLLGEVISIEQRRMAEPSVYAGMSDESGTVPESAPGILSVKVLGRTPRECAEMSKAAQEVLLTYYDTLRDEIGEHTLQKLSGSVRKVRRPDIVQTRLDMQREMGELLKQIDELEKQQLEFMKVWQKETQTMEKGTKKEPAFGLYLLLGALLGGAVACVCLAIQYLFDGKMHSAQTLSIITGKSGYGLSKDTDQKVSWLDKRLRSFQRGALPVRNMEELAGLAEKEMQLAGGEKPFAVISSVSAKEYELFCEKLRTVSQAHGRKMCFYAGDACSAECLDVISGAQGIIWLEQKDVSRNGQIRKIEELCRVYEVPVLMNLCILS